ncbi:MAG: hypothetical protein J6M38_00950 [Lentisphaeria bacterium]|nr:hypothetical protein [Lentisphaeria bacterium]
MKAKVPETQNHTVRVEIPGIADRRQVHILNPASGGTKGGKAYEAAKRAIENTGGEIRISEKPGGIEDLTAELFAKDPFSHAIVYGGDGSVYEAVNGIMKSGNSRTGSFSVIPLGSGNDFSRYVNDSGVFQKAELNKIDIIKSTADGVERYCANVMNMGFDCSVVWDTYTLKKYPLLKGSMAYFAGVAVEFLKKRTFDGKVTLFGCEALDPDDNKKVTSDEVMDQKILLCACANSRFYGGGFCAAPIASINDGMMDVLVVDDVTRMEFISLVGAYHEGTFIDDHGVMMEKFKKLLKYKRCRAIEITGPERFCLDGEIFRAEGKIRGEIVPGALWFAAL